LDVSLKLTSICIVDRTGKVEREGVVASAPEAIATFIKLRAPHVVRIGLETGATSTWLWTELNKIGLPVICIDARRAKAVLKMQINKSDRNDAAGIARIMQCGWYKEVCVKDLDSHATKALLVSRALLVKMKRDIENQVRWLLKNLGLVIGRAKMNMFAVRAAQLAEDRSELFAAVDSLLKAREAIEQQIVDLDRKVSARPGPSSKKARAPASTQLSKQGSHWTVWEICLASLFRPVETSTTGEASIPLKRRTFGSGRSFVVV
jgi:transposase